MYVYRLIALIQGFQKYFTAKKAVLFVTVDKLLGLCLLDRTEKPLVNVTYVHS